MSPLRIAAAQSVSIPGDIAANVATHCHFIERASALGVDILLFPELSLTGYELALLECSVLTPEDNALAPIRSLAQTRGMTIIVGAPVNQGSRLPGIGAISFFADGSASVYHKQYLHAGEERFATAGPSGSDLFRANDEVYAQAICADTIHEAHPAAAAAAGATLYLAGVLISEGGYAADSAQLQHQACRFRMATLIANHGGPSGDYISAGKSAFWANDGTLVTAAPGKGSCLVVMTKAKAGDTWSGEVVPI